MNTLIQDFPAQEYTGVEFEPTETILRLQNRLLRDHLRYTVRNSPFYNAIFAKEGLDPQTVASIADLRKIPCTAKKDITGRNRDFLASPESDIADICLTSATTGDRPTILYQSFSDLARLAYNEEAAFAMMGITSGDTVLICAALDRCFMAGLAYYLGGLKSRAAMVRAGAGSAAQQWQMVRTTQPTVIIGVPSLMRKIADAALESGENPAAAGIRKLVAIGEPVRDREMNLLPACKEIETRWNAPLYSTYASTEMATAFCECPERRGGHPRPELVILEVLDEHGLPVPPGETGEVVVTPLGVTGMPLLRFRTGDLSFLMTDPCACGRNTPRLGPVIGRKEQMLKFKGTTLFPSALLSVVNGIKGVAGVCIQAETNSDGTDRVRLFASASNSAGIEETITEKLRAAVRVVPEITIIPEEELNRKIHQPGKRKKITFLDLRTAHAE